MGKANTVAVVTDKYWKFLSYTKTIYSRFIYFVRVNDFSSHVSMHHMWACLLQRLCVCVCVCLIIRQHCLLECLGGWVAEAPKTKILSFLLSKKPQCQLCSHLTANFLLSPDKGGFEGYVSFRPSPCFMMSSMLKQDGMCTTKMLPESVTSQPAWE